MKLQRKCPRTPTHACATSIDAKGPRDRRLVECMASLQVVQKGRNAAAAYMRSRKADIIALLQS